MKSLTPHQAFKAMYLYLHNLYELTGSEDLAGLLGSMSLLEDGMPVDSACWEDWIDAIEKIKSEKINLDIK